MKLSEAESILLFVSDGNPAEAIEIKEKCKRKMVLNYYYKKRVMKLNELRAAIAQLKNMERDKK